MKIAVIPARGGSKRIPRKNIKPFCGKPMIAYSIEAALASGCFDQIIVSTDDDEIAAEARRYGAQTPFLRPLSLSDDHTGTVPVIRHAIKWLYAQNFEPHSVCCIYATAPFLEPHSLRHGLQVLEETGSDFAFSVTSYAFPIQRALRVNSLGRVEMIDPAQFSTRSQDLEETFHDAGQFYWGRTQAWLERTPVFGPSASPVILPRYRVQDIDNMEDWTRAELMFKVMQADFND